MLVCTDAVVSLSAVVFDVVFVDADAGVVVGGLRDSQVSRSVGS